MDLGQAIAIFLAIAVILMILFCLVTKYFNYKLQKALQQNDEVYSMIDEINSTDQIEGQYEDFIRKREEQKQTKKKKGKQAGQFQLEMTDVRDPLMGSPGISKLRRRLEGQTIPMRQETDRSVNTMRSFKPQLVDSSRNRSVATPINLEKIHDSANGAPQRRSSYGNRGFPSSNKGIKNQSNVIEHKFLSKLVAYTQNGIQIVQIDLKSLKKGQNGEIIQRKLNKAVQVKAGQKSFQDQLQVYGFQLGQHGAYKFITKVQIPHMKDGQQYPFSALKNTEEKQGIDFIEYHKIKAQIQNQN